jgi:hypothetical protein
MLSDTCKLIEAYDIILSHKVAKYEYPPVQPGVDDYPIKPSPERALYFWNRKEVFITWSFLAVKRAKII